MPTKKTKNNPLYDDHDDAHFDGNPAYRKRPAKKRATQEVKDASMIMHDPKNPKEKAEQSKYFSRRMREQTKEDWKKEARANAKKKGIPYAKEYAAEDAQRRKVSQQEEEAYRKSVGRKRVAGNIRTGAGASGRTGKYVGGKKRPVKKRVAGK